ncbi:MAG: DUF6293 family protein [Candidatus Bathyarchaeia archaeon]
MSGIMEIVHIIPLGHELDRAIKPFKKYKANRVYLLTIEKTEKIPYITDEMYKRQQHFLNLAKKALEDKGIEVKVEHTNIFEMLDVLRQVSKIVRKEKERKNMVYVNISSAGRLTSSAATLAAMAHGAKAYYVWADRYSKTEEEELQHGMSICEGDKIIELPNFHITLPDEISCRLLSRLFKEERGMKTDEIINFLNELGIEDFDEKSLDIEKRKDKRQVQQTFINRLNKKILDKLELEGYIKREKSGRYSKIKITEAGKYIAHISGFIE